MGRQADLDDLVSSSAPMGDLLSSLAEWSPWVPFAEAAASAPRTPGVYLAREGLSGPVVYVGMAGERASGGTPKGLRGRLAVYASGKALASGLGEAVFDRALADPSWVREQLAKLGAGQPERAKAWGRAAFIRADLHLCWATTANRTQALALERATLTALTSGDVWNRAR